jgi:hypothetical protein
MSVWCNNRLGVTELLLCGRDPEPLWYEALLLVTWLNMYFESTAGKSNRRLQSTFFISTLEYQNLKPRKTDCHKQLTFVIVRFLSVALIFCFSLGIEVDCRVWIKNRSFENILPVGVINRINWRWSGCKQNWWWVIEFQLFLQVDDIQRRGCYWLGTEEVLWCRCVQTVHLSTCSGGRNYWNWCLCVTVWCCVVLIAFFNKSNSWFWKNLFCIFLFQTCGEWFEWVFILFWCRKRCRRIWQ